MGSKAMIHEFPLKASKSLPTDEARKQLPGLVSKARALKTASKSLAARAVEIGPYNKGGAWLVPEVDAQAAVQREAELGHRVEELENQLENLAIAALVAERIGSEQGERISGIDFIRELGHEDIAREVEAERSFTA